MGLPQDRRTRLRPDATASRSSLRSLGHETHRRARDHRRRLLLSRVLGGELLLGSLVIPAGFFFVDRAGRWLIERFRTHLGLDRLSDIASVPLVHVSLLFLGPVVLA